MKKTFLLLILAVIMGQSRAQESTRRPGTVSDSVIVLSNGWLLTPAGHGFQLGDLPLNIAISANERWAAVTNNGQSTQTLQLIDVAAEKGRLAKRVEEYQAEIAKVEQKLSNPAFTQKVPPTVLQEQQKRLADWQEKLAHVRKALEALG